MPKQQPQDDFRPEDYPITWFAEMLLAIDRGDFQTAANAQNELARLGWRVDRKPQRKPTAPRLETREVVQLLPVKKEPVMSKQTEIETGVGEVHAPTDALHEHLSRCPEAQEMLREAWRELEQVRGHLDAARKWLMCVETTLVELRESRN